MTKELEKAIKRKHEDDFDLGSKRTKSEQDDFKKKLITYYQCEASNNDQVYCMLLGQV
jgi:hypothetical protein